ncbi:hypothetical protein Tco_1024215 [Tanacetum coccineum]
MLVRPTKDEGAPSETPSEAQPTPSPIHTSEVPLMPQTDPSPTHTSEVPVKPQTDPSPRPLPSTTIPDSIPDSSGGNLRGHSSSDKSLSGNEGEMTLQSVYDLCLSLCAQIPKDTLDYIKTEDAQDVGRTRDVVDEDKEKDSTDEQNEVSTDRPIVSTDGSKVSTDRQKDSIDEQNKGTDDQSKGTDEQSKGTDEHTKEGRATKTTQPLPTSTIFGDDETIAKLRRSLNSLKVMKRWLGKCKKSGKANPNSSPLTKGKSQDLLRNQFTIEERAKFLHDTIAAQRKFLAQQRSEAIRNRPPTKNQLKNQMMTYLKHVVNFKHFDLKTKNFEEIQALYEKIKNEDFISIGSAEDERLIKRMNEKGVDSS